MHAAWHGCRLLLPLLHRRQAAGTLHTSIPLLLFFLIIVPSIQDLLQRGPLQEGVGQLARRRRRHLCLAAQAGIQRRRQRLAVEPHANQHQLLPAVLRIREA